jgi:hypothetical protein
MVFASMIDDPSAWPELFPSNEMQEVERHPLAEQITENFEKLEI